MKKEIWQDINVHFTFTVLFSALVLESTFMQQGFIKLIKSDSKCFYKNYTSNK